MSESNRGGVAVAGVVLLVAAIGGFFYLRQGRDDAAERAPAPPPVVPSAPVEAEPAVPAHPIEDAIADAPAEPEAPPLPALGESDPAALEALLALIGSDTLPPWLVPEYVIQRTVATIDNLPRAKVPSNVSVVRPTSGALAVEGAGVKRTLSDANFTRYAPQVAAFENADTATLVAGYVRHYPLFQQAYRELGTEGYFNDRLVAVIDHLLDAPAVPAPIELVRPKVFWEFADPRLESLSAGHKLMVRLGPDQASRVKAKLRELRAGVTGAELGGEVSSPGP